METALNVFVASVNLGYVVVAAWAFGAHCSSQQSDSGTYVGACLSAGACLAFAVVAYDLRIYAGRPG
jgi:hypothetical protein